MFFRRFEERVGLAYTKRKFSGFCHLHIGQEALAVGVQSALRPTDYMLSSYRSHTQAIGKGIPAGQVMAELFGKVDGVCRGKGGSMHMFSDEHRFFGGHGIVGGQVPIAAGIAFKIRYSDEDEICVCYLGDAATNQGQFHEALNMAATWDLPVLYIIENNKYGMGTDIKRTTSVDHLWKRALAYDMDHSDVDGMDVVAVHDHVNAIVENMRKTKRPYLLDALTYRYRGHSFQIEVYTELSKRLKSIKSIVTLFFNWEQDSLKKVTQQKKNLRRGIRKRSRRQKMLKHLQMPLKIHQSMNYMITF